MSNNWELGKNMLDFVCLHRVIMVWKLIEYMEGKNLFV